MNESKTRSTQQIFSEMHRELRSWNPEIPESPERLDPALRILLMLFSHQLHGLDNKIDQVRSLAGDALLRAVCPESLRWPIPAFTVMQCRPRDPVVEVDTFTRFYHREEREGGQTFFFTPLRKEKILDVSVKRIILNTGQDFVDLSPQTVSAEKPQSRNQTSVSVAHPYHLYLGIDFRGNVMDFRDSLLFIKGAPELLKQLQWGYWYPITAAGVCRQDRGFCPGLSGPVENMFRKEGHPLEWGGLRSSADLFAPLVNSFVILPEFFANTWESGPAPAPVNDFISRSGGPAGGASEKLFWMRIDLPRGGDKGILRFPFEIFFDCIVAVNKNELTLFKHTGGYRLVEVELPENIVNILEVTRVVDAQGKVYKPAHEIKGAEFGSYTLEERGEKLILWFDFSQEIGFPPDAITVNYAVTTGISANGIAAGKIIDLYENHPGLKECRNLIPTQGAIPAKTEEQIVTEVATRLRNRDRALSFRELTRWAQTFDPRIKNVVCTSGVERAARGVRRCIVVKTVIDSSRFLSDDEINLLQSRLGRFLRARSPLNTRFKIEIIPE